MDSGVKSAWVPVRPVTSHLTLNTLLNTVDFNFLTSKIEIRILISWDSCEQ